MLCVNPPFTAKDSSSSLNSVQRVDQIWKMMKLVCVNSSNQHHQYHHHHQRLRLKHAWICVLYKFCNNNNQHHNYLCINQLLIELVASWLQFWQCNVILVWCMLWSSDRLHWVFAMHQLGLLSLFHSYYNHEPKLRNFRPISEHSFLRLIIYAYDTFLANVNVLRYVC